MVKYLPPSKDKTIYIRDGRAPIPEKESTSRTMSANKAKNTKPEILLRTELYKSRVRGYRIHPKDIPGRPDIVIKRIKLAVFVNGCFWHRCPKCALPLPKSNVEFWQNKFGKNVERDKNKLKMLKALGWKTVVIWECELKPANIQKTVNKLIKRIAAIDKA